jgi:MYXO-CTERM domain-containing protein
MKSATRITASVAASVATSLAATQFAAASLAAPVYLQSATFTIDVGGQSSSGSWNNSDGLQKFTYYNTTSGVNNLKAELQFNSRALGTGTADDIRLGAFKMWNVPNQLITFTIDFTLSTACTTPVTPGGGTGTLDGTPVSFRTLAAGNHTLVYQFDITSYGAYGQYNMWDGVNTMLTLYPTAVPAPGAIALLGLAGLAGRRRR